MQFIEVPFFFFEIRCKTSCLSPLTLILTSLLMWGGRLELLTVLLIFRMRTWKVLRAGKIDEAGSKILARFSRIMGSFRRQSKK